MLRKMFALLFVLCCFAGVAAAAEVAELPSGKIAVVPYIDLSEQNKGYVKDTVDEKYTNYFGKAGFEVIPAGETARALQEAGYKTEDQMLPDKDTMAEIARATGADYVVALELTNINSSRHESYFSTKVTTTVKMRYNFYKAETQKMVPFQTSAVNNNKAVMVGMRSFKSSIVDALTEAMKKGNERIKSLL